jgi:hypothetical protein
MLPSCERHRPTKGEKEMKSRLVNYLGSVLTMLFLSASGWSDQIILKDGTVFSGKFVRGDSKAVDFQVLGRIETFKTTDVDRIVFKDSGSSAPSLTKAPISPAAPAQAADPTPVSPPAAATNPQKIAPAVEAAPSAILPAGTSLIIRISTAIDTDRNRAGDTFDATLDEALVWGSQTLAPRGSTVKGRIAYAQESGKLTGKSQMILELTELVVNGKSHALHTSDYTEVGSSRGKRTAAVVGGTAALGAIIGAVAGGGKGAAIGGASGAAVGTGVQVLTKGEVLKIPAETIIDFKLQSPLNLDTR